MTTGPLLPSASCKAGAISLLNRSFSLVAISFSALFHGFGVPDGVYRFVKFVIPYLSSTELHLRQMRTVFLPFFSWRDPTAYQV